MLVVFAALSVITGLAYPLVTTSIANVTFSDAAGDAERLTQANTNRPFLGLLGQPPVNALTLNLELDAAKPDSAGVH